MRDGTIERRHQRRFAARNFSFFGDGNKCDRLGYTLNISEGGVFFETKVALAPNSFVDTEIFLDLGNDVIPIKTRGQVVWVSTPMDKTPSGFGIRFVEMDSAVKKALLSSLVLA
jgi:hypothetical protein